MNITNQDINNYTEEIFTVLNQYFDSVEDFKNNLEKKRTWISSNKINYCLGEFIRAEFDYQTQGLRGLGRMTDQCPRLAAYFRKSFTKITPQQILTLDNLVTKLIIKSYLFSLILSSQENGQNPIQNEQQFFERWIPEIYIFDLNSIGEHVLNLLFAVIESDYTGIERYLKDNGMVPGMISFNDKTHEILNGYVSAGLTMGMVESE